MPPFHGGAERSEAGGGRSSAEGGNCLCAVTARTCGRFRGDPAEGGWLPLRYAPLSGVLSAASSLSPRILGVPTPWRDSPLWP